VPHALVRAISTADVDPTVVAVARDANQPRIATDLAILHERAPHVGLEIDLHCLATVRALHYELGIHKGIVRRAHTT